MNNTKNEVFLMKAGIFFHKRTGEPVQIIARAQTKPTFQEVICYQELTAPYDHFVMEKTQFFSEYVKHFDELPLTGHKQIGKRDDLPDKRPLISKGEIHREEEDEEEKDPRIRKLLAFFDAGSYREKIKMLEKMKDDMDSFMINNIAVSLDLSIEDGVDGYEFILSELRMRDRYESHRGDRF